MSEHRMQFAPRPRQLVPEYWELAGGPALLAMSNRRV